MPLGRMSPLSSRLEAITLVFPGLDRAGKLGFTHWGVKTNLENYRSFFRLLGQPSLITHFPGIFKPFCMILTFRENLTGSFAAKHPAQQVAIPADPPVDDLSNLDHARKP